MHLNNYNNNNHTNNHFKIEMDSINLGIVQNHI